LPKTGGWLIGRRVARPEAKTCYEGRQLEVAPQAASPSCTIGSISTIIDPCNEPALGAKQRPR
jgi:hypothetical protein